MKCITNVLFADRAGTAQVSGRLVVAWMCRRFSIFSPRRIVHVRADFNRVSSAYT